MAMKEASSSARFGRLIERSDGKDFPFYNFLPLEVSTWKWLTIIGSTIVAFLMLVFWESENQFVLLIPRILFTLIPLVTFAVLARPAWNVLFQPLHLRDLGSIVVFWLITLVVSLAIGSLVRAVVGANADSATDNLAGLPAPEMVAFFIGAAIQILGEELFSLLPFLALLYWFSKAGLGRRKAVILSWLITALWFGLAHLPAYQWNLIQVVAVIGVSRLIFTLAYIRTKNIWVSTGAHLLHDWFSFVLIILPGVVLGGSLI